MSDLKVVEDGYSCAGRLVQYKQNLAVDEVIATLWDVDGLVRLVKPHTTIDKRLFLYTTECVYIVALPSLLVARNH